MRKRRIGLPRDADVGALRVERGNAFKIEENPVSGRLGAILGGGSRQGRSRDVRPRWGYSSFSGLLLEKVIQNVPFWKFRKSKIAPKSDFSVKIGTGTL